MDIKQIEKLVNIINTSNIKKIEVKDYYTTVYVVTSDKKNDLNKKNTEVIVKNEEHKQLPKKNDDSDQLTNNEVKYIKSPMIGTFYRSSSPNSKPFVTEGQYVNSGDVLCIIEAMKIMNKIETDISGRITKVIVNDGENIEYDQPLFIIDK